MKKHLLICIAFLTLGLFQVSESVAAKEHVALTDSILNVKINNSEAMKELQSRLDKQKSLIEQQNKRIEELSSQNVPGWQLALILIDTIGALCFFISKFRKGNKGKKEEITKQTNSKVSSNFGHYNVGIETQSSSKNVPEDPQAPHVAYHNEDNSRNVVIVKYVKDEPSGNMPVEKTKEKRKAKLHRFANFMIENGRISTLERTISDDSSDKLFAIDYEEGSNVATYTINPKCKAAILSDIQTFQNYVAKFNITGIPSDIVVKKVGRLNKVGKQWIVTEKLVVEFK